MATHGRNDPCWCGSGKKYKHCHSDRASQKKLPKSESFARLRQGYANDVCYVHPDQKKECSGKPINSHILSKSRHLNRISKDDEVWSLKMEIKDLIKSKGKRNAVRYGINKFSTFSGFCSLHDKQLFSCIEDTEFTFSGQQILSLTFRTISREVNGKRGAARVIPTAISEMDRGLPVDFQEQYQSIANINKEGADESFQDHLTAYEELA